MKINGVTALVSFIIAVFLLSLVSVACLAQVEAKANTSIGKNDTENETDIENGNKTGAGFGIGQELSQLISERKEELKTGNYTGPQGQLLNVKELSATLRELRVGNVSVRTKMNITKEVAENKTKLKVNMSNGKGAEIKVMPDTASEIALERLRLKVCSPENNCSIQLKEVGKGENSKVAYELQIERHAKLLGLFAAKMQVKTQVDAETGDVIKVMKPWWAFLAAEPQE